MRSDADQAADVGHGLAHVGVDDPGEQGAPGDQADGGAERADEQRLDHPAADDAADGDAVGEHGGVLAGALVGVDRARVEGDQQRHRGGDRDGDEQDLVELLHGAVDGVGGRCGALDGGDGGLVQERGLDVVGAAAGRGHDGDAVDQAGDVERAGWPRRWRRR